MRRLPRTLRLVSHRFEVIKEHPLEHDGDACYGLTDPHNLLIYIDPTYSPERQKQTLIHEVLHSVIAVSAMAAAESEEDAATRLAPLLLDFIRSNKAAIAYLQEVS